MGGVKTTWNRQGKFNIHGNPMSEYHPDLSQVVAQNDVPFRKVVDKNRTSRPKHAYAVVYPFLTPGDVFLIRSIIIYPGAIYLGKVERGVSKYRVNSIVTDKRKKF